MNSLVNQTARDVSIPINPKKSDHLFFWSMGLIVSALYQLGIYALKKGGTVEFQFGPLTYKVSGRQEQEKMIVIQNSTSDRHHV